MKLVFIENNRPVTDSLTVSGTFGKEHKHVMRDIRELECSEEFHRSNFGLVDYLDAGGRTYQKYVITQDGFSFLVMGYTGKEAARFKEMYINEFNRMKAELNKPQFALPQTMAEALRLAADLSEQNERLAKEKLLVENTLDEQRPLVAFAETCMDSERNLLVREVAKLASKNGIMIGEKRLYNKLREWGLVILNGTEPTQRGMEMGIFEVIKGVRVTPTGSRDWETTKVTPKGQAYIINRLRKDSVA